MCDESECVVANSILICLRLESTYHTERVFRHYELLLRVPDVLSLLPFDNCLKQGGLFMQEAAKHQSTLLFPAVLTRPL